MQSSWLDGKEGEGDRRIGLARLLIGLAQGALLYGLYRAVKDHAWPATNPWLFAPLLLWGLFVPALLITGLASMRPRQLAVWVGAAVLILAALSWHDVWRGAGDHWTWMPMEGRRSPLPSGLLLFFSGVGLFIAHALVLAGAADGRRIARYASYFDSAWKLGIQLLFSAFFVWALWMVLWLGAMLFMLVKLNFLSRWLGEAWFMIPVIAFAFSCALHLTDVRPAIVRGIRGLLLVLASWILPIAVLLIGGFLLTLPFTGLTLLWATRHATSVLLGATALLVVLINTAYQDGTAGAGLAPLLRWSARIAALLVLPLTLIGLYALGLRVNQYGWTSDRVIGAACQLVAVCYALGYARAALFQGRDAAWLQPVAATNVLAALLTLAVLLALFSPLADPARLSVADQVKRLRAGLSTPENVDLTYLRRGGARYGAAALAELRASPPAPRGWSEEQNALFARRLASAESEAAADARAEAGNARQLPAGNPDARNLHVWPAGATLPEGLLLENWGASGLALPACLKSAQGVCDVYLIDLRGDGKPQALVIGATAGDWAALLGRNDSGRWTVLQTLYGHLAGCAPLRQRLQAGRFTLETPPMKDLRIGAQVLHMNQPSTMSWGDCPVERPDQP